MRVLLTGGCGFLGSHMVRSLVNADHHVMVLDDLSHGTTDRLKDMWDRIAFVQGSVLDGALVTQLCEGQDVVSHHAAQLSIWKGIETPLTDLIDNTVGTITVLQACKKVGVPHLVLASSACVYGRHTTPRSEEDSTYPCWEYGCSKLAGEHYGRIYAERYGLAVTTLRYSIVYGEGEWFGRALPRFIRRVVNGESPVVFSPLVIRDYIHVEDVVRAHNKVLDRYGSGFRVYNVSTGIATTIQKLAELVVKCSKKPLDVHYEYVKEGEASQCVEGYTRQPSDTPYMVLNPRKIIRELGVMPQVTLEQGIRRTARWSEEHQFYAE